MRRTSLLASAAVLLATACDPTGIVQPPPPSAGYRFVNAVADASGLVVQRNGAVLVSGVTFGSVSSRTNVSPDSTILVVSRNSDAFLLGSDTLIGIEGRKYTMFGLGTVSNFKS